MHRVRRERLVVVDSRASGAAFLTGKDTARVCSSHHDRITYDGFAPGGEPGAWEFKAPEVALFDTG